MELRHLRAFVAAAEERNISRAAQRVHLTQPALSRQIKGLEDELGVTLLQRGANSIALTAAGEIMLTEAREVLARARLARERVLGVSGVPQLRIGYAPSLAAGLLPIALEAFTQKHPRVRVELLDLSTLDMLEGLAQGELDLALTIPPPETRGVTWTKLLAEPWCLAMQKAHPLARREFIDPPALARERLVMFCRKDYPDYWHNLETWFRQHGLKPVIAGEYDGISSLMAAVEAGLGLALLGGRSARTAPAGVVVRPLRDGPEPGCVAAGTPAARTNDPVRRVFIAELEQAARSMAGPSLPVPEAIPVPAPKSRRSRRPAQRPAPPAG